MEYSEKSLGRKVFEKTIAFIIVLSIVFAVYLVFNSYRKVNTNRLDINVIINSDGSIDVVESYEYKFTGKYNGIYRDFNLINKEELTINEITTTDKDGRTVKYNDSLSATEGTYYLDETGSLKIYSKSKNETKKVTINYTVKNASKKYKENSVFYWKFYELTNGDTINKGSITVSLGAPEGSTKFKISKFEFFGNNPLSKSNENGVARFEFEKLSSNLGVLLEFDRDFLDYNVVEYNYPFNINSEAPIENNSSNKGIVIEGWVVNVFLLVVLLVRQSRNIFLLLTGRASEITFRQGRRNHYSGGRSSGGRSSSGGF